MQTFKIIGLTVLEKKSILKVNGKTILYKFMSPFHRRLPYNLALIGEAVIYKMFESSSHMKCIYPWGRGRQPARVDFVLKHKS